MCLACRYMLPYDGHGNPGHLTLGHLQKSAKVGDMSLDEFVANLAKTVEVAKQETEHKHR